MFSTNSDFELVNLVRFMLVSCDGLEYYWCIKHISQIPRRTDGRTDRRTDGRMDRRTGRREDRWEDRREDRQTDRRMDGWTSGWAGDYNDGRTDGRTEARRGGRMDGWTEIQTDRQTYRQTGRQAGRETDRQTDRQTERETGRQAHRQLDCYRCNDKAKACQWSVWFTLWVYQKTATHNSPSALIKHYLGPNWIPVDTQNLSSSIDHALISHHRAGLYMD